MTVLFSAATRLIKPGLIMAGAVLATAVLPAVGAAASQPPAPAAAPTRTWQFCTPVARGGYCGDYLEIYHSGTANGNYADAYAGNGTKTQKWAAIYLGSSQYAFENENSGKCLDDNNYQLTGHVDQWSCTSYGDYIRWYENYTSLAGGGYGLENVGTQSFACVFSSIYGQWVMLGAAGSGDCFWH